MKSITSFKKLVNNYDYFLFDQWGVLHNGTNKFSKAEECLKFLKDKQKKIVLISNSSKPTNQSIKHLDKLGISNNLYDYCITSGQIALNYIEKDIYTKYGKKCFPLELPKEKKTYFKLKCTNNIKLANFAMIADLKDDLTILDFAKNLDEMLKYKLPLLCANPDYLVHNNKKLSMCGGTIANLYADLGGIVFRYGKPFYPIYQDVIKKMRIKNHKRVLAVGDSLWHDIDGGKKMNFDTLWIKKGIHSSQLSNKNEINLLLKKYTPKYAISHLQL